MATQFNPFTQKLDLIIGDGLTISSVDISDFVTSVDTVINNNTTVQNATHSQDTDTALRVDKLVVDTSGNTDIAGELSIKVYVQALEPILTANTRMAMWENTNSGNVFLIYKDSNGNNKLVELG